MYVLRKKNKIRDHKTYCMYMLHLGASDMLFLTANLCWQSNNLGFILFVILVNRFSRCSWWDRECPVWWGQDWNAAFRSLKASVEHPGWHHNLNTDKQGWVKNWETGRMWQHHPSSGHSEQMWTLLSLLVVRGHYMWLRPLPIIWIWQRRNTQIPFLISHVCMMRTVPGSRSPSLFTSV